MKRLYLNDGWKFTENYSNHLCYPEADVSSLVDVRLPHTCKELPYHYFDESLYQMVSGYRRVLSVPEEWMNKCATIWFCYRLYDLWWCIS